eukprot:7023368-Prymnesium_polylepis.1
MYITRNVYDALGRRELSSDALHLEVVDKLGDVGGRRGEDRGAVAAGEAEEFGVDRRRHPPLQLAQAHEDCAGHADAVEAVDEDGLALGQDEQLQDGRGTLLRERHLVLEHRDPLRVVAYAVGLTPREQVGCRRLGQQRHDGAQLQALQVAKIDERRVGAPVDALLDDREAQRRDQRLQGAPVRHVGAHSTYLEPSPMSPSWAAFLAAS